MALRSEVVDGVAVGRWDTVWARRLLGWHEWLHRRRMRWEDRAGREGFYGRHGFLFGEHAVPYYAVLELSIAAACGVLEGLRINRAAVCHGALVAVGCLLLLQAAFVLWRRPALVRAEAAFLVAVAAVGVVIAVASFVSVAVPSAGNVTLYAVLCGQLLATLKMLFDVAMCAVRPALRRGYAVPDASPGSTVAAEGCAVELPPWNIGNGAPQRG